MTIDNVFYDLFEFSRQITSFKLKSYKKAPANSNSIAVFHYQRVKQLLKGLTELCAKGLYIEAQILLRSLLNLYINLRWINIEDTENRQQRFMDFELIFRKKASESTYKFDGILIDTSTEEYKQSEVMFNSLISKYNIKDYKKLRSWSPKSIRQMAEDTKLEWEYEVFYSRLSEYEHCGPSSVVDYFNNGQISFEPKDENLPIILISGCDYFLFVMGDVLKMINGHFNDISFARLDLNNLSVKYFKNSD